MAASFATREDAARSPLASRLYEIDGVTRVFFGADFITVTTADDQAPPQLQLDQRSLLLAIQALLHSDLELFRAKIGERGQQVGDLVLGFGHVTPAVGHAILL